MPCSQTTTYTPKLINMNTVKNKLESFFVLFIVLCKTMYKPMYVHLITKYYFYGDFSFAISNQNSMIF